MESRNRAVQYYDATAEHYDGLHSIEKNPEHSRAMELGWPLFGQVGSVLDVGSGTGRSLCWLRERHPGVALYGVEPSAALLDIAGRNLPDADLRQGIGERLPYADNSIDVVIATAIMHHADDPPKIISEMFRVARNGILISDHNNYAFGGALAKRLRMGLKLCGLLGAANYIRNGFKPQGYSEGDGWWYPYSLLDNYAQIAMLAENTFIFPTRRPTTGLGNLIFSQGHLAIVATKRAVLHRSADERLLNS